MRIKIGNFVLFLALLGLWHLAFSVFALYNSRRMFGRLADLIDTLMASAVGILLIGMVAVIFRIRLISPSFLAMFGTIATTAAICQRFALRALLEHLRLTGQESSQPIDRRHQLTGA